LLRAGMTVVEAVDTLASRSAREHGDQEVLQSIRQSLQSGHSFSQALEAQRNVPQVLLASVRAGERTSKLAEALDDFLRFDDLVSRLRGKVVSAAIYPALVTALGLAISLFLLLVVMPNFARMYENVRGRGTMAASLIVRLSIWMSANRTFVLVAGVVAALACAIWIRSGGPFRFARWFTSRTPWLREHVEDFQLAMMYQALSVLLKGGFPMTEAMQVSARSALNERLRGMMTSAQSRVTEGTSVAQALSDARLCDEVDRRLMAAAERNGDFHAAAEVISRIHGERFEVFVERVARIAEPVLLLGVALMVGTIVVTMYLPVFDIATQLR
jgi:general secretion pathway protein F